MNVRLRAAHAADERWINSWLPEVEKRVGREVERDGSCERLVILCDGEPSGMLIVRRANAPDAEATIELVATPPDRARRGIGMMAAQILLRRLARERVQTVWAPAPERHGIAMYFWIRLGFQPLLHGAGPCETPGVAWLRRDLAAPVRRRAAEPARHR